MNFRKISIFLLSLIASTFLPFLCSPAIAKIAKETKSKLHYKYSYKVKGKTYRVLTKDSAKQYEKKGIASWYGGKFHGRKTAMGSRYNKYAMTAASKVLPLGSKVRVTNLKNHKKVVLTINDRGPFYNKRIIDLSLAAAKKLGFKEAGTTRVAIKVIKV